MLVTLRKETPGCTEDLLSVHKAFDAGGRQTWSPRVWWWFHLRGMAGAEVDAEELLAERWCSSLAPFSVWKLG